MFEVRPRVTQEADVWVLRVEKPNGKVQEYRCASEGQARQFAQVLVARPEPGEHRPSLE